MTATALPPPPKPGFFSKARATAQARVVDPMQRTWRKFNAPNRGVISFQDLYEAESHQLDPKHECKKDDSQVQILNGSTGEPAIRFTPHDRFGLALSGGGIRSATFNLGILQSLARLGILEQVDYLSTVSGGGYVGGFWTAWLHREKAHPRPIKRPFPAAFNGATGESPEIRHLREFSRFLLPRMGFFETEFWAIVMTVLGGMLPSLLTALAVLATAWYLWIVGLIALTAPGFSGAAISALALLFYLGMTEFFWLRAGRAEPNRTEANAYVITSLATALVALAMIRAHALNAPRLSEWVSFTESKCAFALPALLGTCTLMLLGARVVAARFIRKPHWIPCVAGVERCTMRMLGLTAGMAVIAGLWLLAAFLGSAENKMQLKVTGTSAGILALVFTWAKKWLTDPVQETRGDTYLAFAVSWLKRAGPKALSTIVWLLIFVCVGALVHLWGYSVINAFTLKFWLPLAASVGVIFLACLLFDPARVGMHEFYRSRISRCYLGASNLSHDPKATDLAGLNRHISERPCDDITLKQMREVARPIHLVCVAANDMSGDQLSNLYRGARSAVLSGNGISLGNKTAPLDDLRLSAALTASAAAFNSQMGRVSMDLGPSVGFLMSAFNLRLGLWVQHPDNRHRGNYKFPGRFFLFELFGMSHTTGGNLHLSDGNHFENFGLYELVRRHCRYILVSDCGADSEVAFDDLANVLRRVREDFGVEIELDVAPLRPDANRRAKQHAVVGTIHYDGMGGMDKGTIIYVKPCLTGDEPPDVLQYSTRNDEFPHEGTADQFYDEAQWESYRRLGEHAMDAVLNFCETEGSGAHNTPDRLFRDARSHWHPAPEDLNVNFLAMSERCANLEHDLMSEGPERLRAEFFVEATALTARGVQPQSPHDPATTSDTPTAPPQALAHHREEIQILSYLVRVAQIMEDLWVAADLDRYWSHPLNEGWMNYFRRWAATPSFRRWWPVIASMYSLGLREFVRKRFNVGAIDPTSPTASTDQNLATLHLREVDNKTEFFAQSFVAQQFVQSESLPNLANYRVLAYDLRLLDYSGALSSQILPVGFALVTENPVADAQPPGTWKAEWDVRYLYVPDSLSGSGFTSKLLDAVLRFYANPASVPARKFSEALVHFTPSTTSLQETRPGRAARYERVRDIEFYKSRGFSYVGAENVETGALTLKKMW